MRAWPRRDPLVVTVDLNPVLGSMSGGDSDEGPKEGNPTETPVERDDKLAKVGGPWLMPAIGPSAGHGGWMCFLAHVAVT